MRFKATVSDSCQITLTNADASSPLAGGGVTIKPFDQRRLLQTSSEQNRHAGGRAGLSATRSLSCQVTRTNSGRR